jgi:hypothetical protein
MINAGFPYWAAFGLTLVFSFIGGDLDDEYFYRVAIIAIIDVDCGVAAFLSVHSAWRRPRR